MILIPDSVASVADAASNNDATNMRWDMTSVRLEHNPEENTYTAVATDGKVLALVTGPVPDDKEFPPLDCLKDAPNSADHVQVPVQVWKDVFGTAQKLHKPRRVRSILKHVAVVMGTDRVTMAATDMETTPKVEALLPAKKFPPYRDIFPQPRAGTLRIAVDPNIMGKALSAAAKFCAEGHSVCELEFFSHERPILIKVSNPETGQEFKSLVMPLSGEDCKNYTKDEIEEVKKLTSEIDRTRTRLNNALDQLSEEKGKAVLYRERCKELEARLRDARANGLIPEDSTITDSTLDEAVKVEPRHEWNPKTTGTSPPNKRRKDKESPKSPVEAPESPPEAQESTDHDEISPDAESPPDAQGSDSGDHDEMAVEEKESV